MEERKPLEKVEDYIAQGDLYSAQNLLNMIDEESGKKQYLQSRVYKEKRWYNEQRKSLKAAVRAEPQNREYKKELTELLEFSKTSEYKKRYSAPQWVKRRDFVSIAVSIVMVVKKLCYIKTKFTKDSFRA